VDRLDFPRLAPGAKATVYSELLHRREDSRLQSVRTSEAAAQKRVRETVSHRENLSDSQTGRENSASGR